MSEFLSQFGIDWKLFLSQLANFVLILVVLNFFIYKPLLKILNEREKKIKKGIEDATRATTELQMARQTSEKAILDAKVQANQIIATSQKESEKIILEGTKIQQEKVKQIIQEAKNAIQKEKEKMMHDLKSEVAELVIVTTEKFIDDNLSKDKKEEITKKLIKSR